LDLGAEKEASFGGVREFSGSERFSHRGGTLMRFFALRYFPGLLAAALAPALAWGSPDELYYPASQCIPFSGSAWQGGGSSGFSFVSAEGGWFNFAGNKEALHCPVPYFRNTGNLERITVRVVTEDGHPTEFVRAFLCERPSEGSKSCVGQDNFPTIFGNSTIELSIRPDAATRFVWIEVEIPADADDDNPFSLNGTSGMIGYRVFRN
jgi:hypothetical protein